MLVSVNVPYDKISMLQSVSLGNKTLFMGAISGDDPQQFVSGEMVKHEKSGSLRLADILASNDYLEIAGDFGQRITAQAIVMQLERRGQNIPLNLVGPESCVAVPNYTGKVVAIRPDVLRPEYRTDAYQLVFVHADKSGVVTGRRLLTNESVKRARMELMGAVPAALLPQWAVPYHRAAQKIHTDLSRQANAILSAVGVTHKHKNEHMR